MTYILKIKDKNLAKSNFYQMGLELLTFLEIVHEAGYVYNMLTP